MATTSKLGTFLSQPAQVVPGAPNSDYVTWQGPFTPGELYEAGTQQNVTNLGAATSPTNVTPTVASQISISDPTWWAYS